MIGEVRPGMAKFPCSRDAIAERGRALRDSVAATRGKATHIPKRGARVVSDSNFSNHLKLWNLKLETHPRAGRALSTCHPRTIEGNASSAGSISSIVRHSMAATASSADARCGSIAVAAKIRSTTG